VKGGGPFHKKSIAIKYSLYLQFFDMKNENDSEKTEIRISFGKELKLQQLRAADAPALFELVEKNRAQLRQFLGWLDHNLTEQETLSFIKRQQERQERGEALTLAIRNGESLIGLVGFHSIDLLNRSASVGYWLDAAHQGKGIMTRAVRALMDYGRYVLNLHRIEVRCATENIKSQAIPTTLGFEREATLKDALWHYDKYLDAFQFSYIQQQEGTVLETERMVLRKLCQDDVDHLQRIFSDPETMRYYPGTKEVEETKRWIEKQLASYKQQGYGLWACHLKETGEFVGQCGLLFWEDIAGEEEVEIGYLFVRQHWKKGLATEAAKACLKYARKTLGRNRLISLIKPENSPSRAVAERMGMEVEKEAEVKGVQALVYAIEFEDALPKIF